MDYNFDVADKTLFVTRGANMLHVDNGQVQWFVNKFSIRRDEGYYSQESEVLISHAATMRAMDAAAKAFKEALK